MSQFAFLRREWPEIFAAAARAEASANADPRTSCFYARRALEMAVAWAFKFDASLKLPYDDKISALIPRADLQAGGRRSRVQQGPRDQHARQSRSAWVAPDSQ